MDLPPSLRGRSRQYEDGRKGFSWGGRRRLRRRRVGAMIMHGRGSTVISVNYKTESET